MAFTDLIKTIFFGVWDSNIKGCLFQRGLLTFQHRYVIKSEYVYWKRVLHWWIVSCKGLFSSCLRQGSKIFRACKNMVIALNLCTSYMSQLYEWQSLKLIVFESPIDLWKMLKEILFQVIRHRCFHSCYGRLAELCSLMSHKVPVVVLAATVTIDAMQFIIQNLCMYNTNVYNSTRENKCKIQCY